MTRRILVALVSVIVVAALSVCESSVASPNNSINSTVPPAYVIVDLGYLREEFVPQAINDSGEFTGFYISGKEVVPFAGDIHGSVREVPTLGGNRSQVTSINNKGQIVGWSQTQSGHYHAFISDAGSVVDLGALGGKRGVAADINNHGQIVGFYVTANGHRHAFTGDISGLTDLGAPGMAIAIDDQGEIVGLSRTETGATHVLFGDAGGLTALNPLQNRKVIRIIDINYNNQIIGTWKRRKGQDQIEQAFVATIKNNTLHLIYIPLLDGKNHNSPSDINDAGLVVGDANRVRIVKENGHTYHMNSHPTAFLYNTNSGVVYDLNDLVVNKQGWGTLGHATAINNEGVIVGFNDDGAFMLVPVPADAKKQQSKQSKKSSIAQYNNPTVASIGTGTCGKDVSLTILQKAQNAVPYAQLSSIVYDHNFMAAINDRLEAKGYNPERIFVQRNESKPGFLKITVRSNSANHNFALPVNARIPQGILVLGPTGHIDKAKFIAAYADFGLWSSGLYAEAYLYHDKIIIAVRGTQPWDLRDWVSDIVQTLGGGAVTPQYREALDAFGYFATEIYDYSRQIVFTGHSLGGGIAQYLATYFHSNAYTFNAAGMGWLSVLESGWEIEPGCEMILNVEATDQSEILIEEDIVSDVGTDLGDVINVPLLPNTGGVILHGINALVASLKTMVLDYRANPAGLTLQKIDRYLDRNYPGWKIAQASTTEYCFSNKSPMNLSIITGDFNGDGLIDFAFQIMTGSDNELHLLAFVSPDNVVTLMEGYAYPPPIVRTPKGSQGYNWETRSTFVYANDAATVVYCGKGSRTFAYSNGRFTKLVTGD